MGVEMMHNKLVLMAILKRYLKLRCEVADGVIYGTVCPIEGQNWLDINEARMNVKQPMELTNG